jgi:acyl-CoA synthetase (AMP-forming)/AMP-acid ligase II
VRHPHPREGRLSGTLWELVSRRAAEHADRRYLLDDSGRSCTYAGFAAAAERTAAGLLALGVGPGDTVSWQLPTWTETVVLSVALARLGARQNPIIPIYGRREVEALVRQSGSKLLVVPGWWRDTDYAAVAAEIASAVGDLEVLVVARDGLPTGDPATLPPPPSDADQVRWLYSTSGTTSLPKGVQHSDASLLAAGRATIGPYELSQDDVGCIPFPYAHIGGADYLTMSLLVGMQLLLLESFVPEQAVALHNEYGVTASGSGTAFYQAFLAEQRKDPTRPVLPTVRYLAGGGAPMPSQVFWDVRREMGLQVLQGYGMTEVPMITTGSPSDTDEQLANTEGRPVVGIELSFRDELGEEVVEGEIWVRGPLVFQGYTDVEATLAAFDDQGFFRTGDIGRLRADGYLRLTGRAKDIIIRKGENVSPQEVEEIVQSHPGVGAVAVIGLPDSERGERVCAVIEVALGHPPPTLEELVDHCRQQGLSRRKSPEQLEVVDLLPRTPTMKVLKRELRQTLGRS